jgi:hypothetical protein
MMRFGTATVLALGCLAQVSTPLIGYYCDQANVLRQLRGITGAFVPGEPVERDVISSAWSGVAGFAKSETELLLLDSSGITERLEAPPGPAIFGFLSDGKRAWVRFADGSCRSFGADCPIEPARKPHVRARLSQAIASFEQLGQGWLLARGEDRLYAIRVGSDDDQAYEIPEAER